MTDMNNIDFNLPISFKKRIGRPSDSTDFFEDEPDQETEQVSSVEVIEEEDPLKRKMIECQVDFRKYYADMKRERDKANLVVARAYLTNSILTSNMMKQNNIYLPTGENFSSGIRVCDNEYVAVTNGGTPINQILDYTNSVPVTNLQDYANIINCYSEKDPDSDYITKQEAASIATNYITFRDQSLLDSIVKNGCVDRLIGKDTIKKIKNTEINNPRVITSPTIRANSKIQQGNEETYDGC